MSEAKHTPGPWSPRRDASNPSGSQWGVVHGPGMWICDCFDNAGPKRAGMGEPNARLIAAAPDLLGALQMLYDETADYIRLNNLGGMDNQCMQMARAALAKATGAAS